MALGKFMISWSLAALGVTNLNLSVKTDFINFSLNPSTLSDGFLIFTLGVGVVFAAYASWREYKVAEDSQLLKIHHMGLVNHNIGDVQNELPKPLKKIKPQPLNIDYAGSHKTENVNSLEEQLRKICQIPEVIKDSGSSLNNGKKHLVYAGVAPVPMVAAAGHILGNMQNIHVADWDRRNKKWHFNDEFDDGEQLVFVDLRTSKKNLKSVSIIISLSLPISYESVYRDFPDSNSYGVKLESGKYGYDQICSNRKQERFALDILCFINNEIIPNYPELQRINFFVAAQSSFVFRLGASLNQGHLPKLLFHHFNPELSERKHPWSVLLRSGSISDYEVVV